MHPKAYAESLTPGTTLNKHNNPPLKSYWQWVRAAYLAQMDANTRNDPCMCVCGWVRTPIVAHIQHANPTGYANITGNLDPALRAQYACMFDQTPTSLSML